MSDQVRYRSGAVQMRSSFRTAVAQNAVPTDCVLYAECLQKTQNKLKKPKFSFTGDEHKLLDFDIF